jgi:hypothetical protein
MQCNGIISKFGLIRKPKLVPVLNYSIEILHQTLGCMVKKFCTVSICCMNVMNTAHIKLSVGPPVFGDCRDITIGGSGVCYIFSTFGLSNKPLGVLMLIGGLN